MRVGHSTINKTDVGARRVSGKRLWKEAFIQQIVTEHLLCVGKVTCCVH